MGSGTALRQHLVEFYEDVGALAERVVPFVESALAEHGAAAAIARPSHLAAFERRLAERGHATDALVAGRRLVLLDASALLDAVMDGLIASSDRFRVTVSGELARLRAHAHGPVHIYVEMVDLLWQSGNHDGALQVEALWADMMREQPFALLCGYAIDSFGRDVAGFAQVCSHHDAVERERSNVALSRRLDASYAVTQLEVRARSLEDEIDRREQVEQCMRELLSVTAELAAARDLETVAQLAVEAGRAAVDANSAGIWLLSDDGTAVELAASSRGTGPDRTRYGRLPLAGDGPVAEALRTGQAMFIGSRVEYEARYPASYARIMAIEPSPHRAVAVLPMLEGGVVGVMTYSYDRDRVFDEASRTFKTLLVRQCALAFERLRLRSQERAQREAAEQSAAAEKQARGDVELLYELIATANRLDSVDEIYQLALRSVMSGSRSDRAAILLKDLDGVMRFKAWDGLSDTYRRAVEGHTPWSPDQPFPAPVVVDDTEAAPAWASFLDVFRAEGLRALAFVPIINRQRELIGKFMLYRNEPRAFSLRDIQISTTVAVHIAQAVERKHKEGEIARAYREEREARLLADEATRAREEILSVVSHDLRNPLGAILMSASALLHVAGADDADHRVRKNLERIHRQAERMTRYIRDLVDFGSIEAGRISLERAQHDAESIITAASELFGPIASERGLKLEASIWPDLPPVECDSERAVQVLANLVANALKVTPRGGAVSIGAEAKNNEVVFYVRDTGPGIAADELPNLFERHWRSKSTTYKGAGLGLSIARGIVDAHGGKIWAESRVGAGSTFYFSLSQEN